MLNELHIENIAVIERADISFGRGLNVLTGETGAGKSIVIDSIGAVLGDRVTVSLSAAVRIRGLSPPRLMWAAVSSGWPTMK